ncbi:hypothetical protein [Desulfobacter latus]|uniref:Lipoprotein n=1 Tax=Desulfobacter latus TaxID=2292 RepID=A0A850T552_9BACT|nr:hypothetical protein [Desulfobacter latus]NWH06913.1 hypothetical protein [Desulfobacter latus]
MRKLINFGVFLFTLGIFCGCTVAVQPRLNSSLGMDAFENMKSIDLHDVDVALYFDPKLKDLKVNQKLKMGEFTFDIGRSFSAKFLKALAYSFKTIHLSGTPAYKGTESIDAIVRVTLEDVDMNMGVKSGFATVSTETYTRLSIRAEIYDQKEKRVVWVGTTQAKESGKHEEMGQMTYQEAGRGIACSVDTTVDKAIGNLINQMSKSSNLSKYISTWEQNKG